jgi:AcrR family transcriptional regulator
VARKGAGDVTTVPERPGRWQELLATAADVFHERGYDAASIQEIADRMGILKGSLYHYIKSKEELAYEIARIAHIRALEYLDEYDAGPSAPPLARLRGLITGNVRFQLENRSLVDVYFGSARHLTTEHRREILGMRRRYNKRLKDVVSAAQDVGSMNPEWDAAAVTTILWGLANNIYRWYPSDPAWTSAEASDLVVDLLIYGAAMRS